ncbi:MAG: MliC family protein [Pikeienuella sp.]
MRRMAICAGMLALGACSGDDPTAPTQTRYLCDGSVSVTVIFNPVSRIATIRGLGPRDILLPQRQAASGFFYATERVSLRGQGSEAQLTVDGATAACVAESPDSAG